MSKESPPNSPRLETATAKFYQTKEQIQVPYVFIKKNKLSNSFFKDNSILVPKLGKDTTKTEWANFSDEHKYSNSQYNTSKLSSAAH